MSLSTIHRNVTFQIKETLQNFSDEIFVEKLRSIKFPDYLNHTCVNDAYIKFVSTFLQKNDSVAPIRAIVVLNPIKNRDKYYKKFK